MRQELTGGVRTPWPPKVWAVMCYRAGDNAQMLALAEALGWPYEVKRLAYRKYEFVTSLLRGTGLTGISKHKSSPLTPPWPDLLISAAFRNEPVCRWIQQQAGGRVCYVHLGRPWARLKHFDLVITEPQYRLPVRSNVLHNHLSLHTVTEGRLAQAAAVWAPHLAHLPRPYIAILIGGYSGPYAFTHAQAERLGRAASTMAREAGGSLLVTTSARTPRAPIETLAAAISVPAQLFRWTPHAVDNPYYGYLALADSLIVTCDSVMMLTEACATRKPVYLFDLGPDAAARQSSPPHASSNPPRYRWWQRWQLYQLKALLYRQLMRIPPRRLSRDVGLVHQYLISSGRAVWLGQPFPPGPPLPPLDDRQRAVARVQALFKHGTTR